VLLFATLTGIAHAGFVKPNNWTIIEDPAHPLMSASVSPAQATLMAGDGPVAANVDIGYISSVGDTSGYSFDPASDFSIAVDFDLSFAGTPTGGLAIGFGIGEDKEGENSAGVRLLTLDGNAMGFGSAARASDVDQGDPDFVEIFDDSLSLSGSFLVVYDAATDNVTVGASNEKGAKGPSKVYSYFDIQDEWGADDFLTPCRK